MSARFTMPAPGASVAVRFPPITRDGLANGLAVWTMSHPVIPAFTASLVLRHGTAHDPQDRPGLASLTSDLLDEGAGGRDAIQLADALARMGADLEIEAGPDATTFTIRALARSLEPALHLLADVVRRPHFFGPDFDRVRELRLSRLRQLRRSAGAMADRTFARAVFGTHAYAHGALGTTASLEAVTLDEARAFWAAMYAPASSQLLVSGDVHPAEVLRAARLALGGWAVSGPAEPGAIPPPVPQGGARLLFVERAGAAQAELRIGHLGPPRQVEAYHALVTLNAVLGGQFVSRINQRLRQEKGVTYGARTSFDFRARGGAFCCDTSVQADMAGDAVSDVLGELVRVGSHDPIAGEELVQAKASLTRGYARHFETPGQIVRAASQLAIYDLPDETFDRFVDRVEAVTEAELHAAARAYVHADTAVVVAVGDPGIARASLDRLAQPVTIASPEF